MRGITKRIFITVIITTFISFFGFFFVLKSMEGIAQKSNTLISGYIENRRVMSEINQLMYNIQATVANCVVNSDPKKEAEYEKKLDELDYQIRELFHEFETHLLDQEEEDLFRQVTNSYNGFASQIDNAVKFRQSGALKSAEYYIFTVVEQYLQDANDIFERYYERTKLMVDQTQNEMISEMQNIRWWRDVVVFVIATLLLISLFVVYQSGKGIVNRHTSEVNENNQRIMDMQYKTIVGMANLIESRDGETGEHVKRTSAYAEMIVEKLFDNGWYKAEITPMFKNNLWKAAPLHDIGKIKISDAILQKPGKLTHEEFERIKLHASEGGKIIDDTMGAIDDKAYLDMAHQVARYHHEKWDGTGYPEGLIGEEIPLCARIMAVADVFDALISRRCYKSSLPVDEAFDIIKQSSGSHFDPKVVEAFLEIRPQVEAYLRKEDKGEIEFGDE